MSIFLYNTNTSAAATSATNIVTSIVQLSLSTMLKSTKIFDCLNDIKKKQGFLAIMRSTIVGTSLAFSYKAIS